MHEERRKIMEAALDEFSERGFTTASLESIADRAGLDPAVARALFLDKERLLDELFREETEPMVNAIALAVQEIEGPKQSIRKTLELLDNWLLLHPKHVKLYMRCSLDESDILQKTFQRYLLPSELFEKLQQIVQKRQVRTGNILNLITLLDSLIMFIHMMRPGMKMIAPELSFEEITRQRFEAVIDLLENGLYSE
jgi:AcrR family transcriptional regulator